MAHERIRSWPPPEQCLPFTTIDDSSALPTALRACRGSVAEQACSAEQPDISKRYAAERLRATACRNAGALARSLQRVRKTRIARQTGKMLPGMKLGIPSKLSPNSLDCRHSDKLLRGSSALACGRNRNCKNAARNVFAKISTQQE
jgi:hypothetical protein